MYGYRENEGAIEAVWFHICLVYIYFFIGVYYMPTPFPGVTSDHTSAPIGSGGYKTVSGADYTSKANEDGFEFSKLPGASQNPADYVIISYKKYDAHRLLEEIELQEEFAPDLAPITFAVEIRLGVRKYTVYGFDDIKTELKKLYIFDANHRVGVAYRTYIEPIYSSSVPIDIEYKRLLDLQKSLTTERLKLISQFPTQDAVSYAKTESELQSTNESLSRFVEYYKVRHERDSIQNIGFRVLMQRTDYHDQNGRTIPVSSIINYDRLNVLFNALLDKGCVHGDIKIDNLCILNGHLGALDYDVKYVKRREYYKKEGPRRTTGKQFMTLMVCLVSDHLSDDTQMDIFNKMGIITQGAPNMPALDGICLVPEFQERIIHYLVPDDVRQVIHQSKPNIRHELLADFIADDYIIPLIPDPNPAPTKKTKGGKSTRKRKRKPKYKKTHRKRSFHNHNLAR